MKILMKAIFMTAVLGLTALYAQDGHSHSGHDCSTHNLGIKSAEVQKIAKKEVERLVLQKKISKSWKSVPVAKIGKMHDAYIDDWKVVFENVKIKKKSKRTLYIFISKKGNVTGANYTGK